MKNNALKQIQLMKPYNPPLSGRRNFGGLLLDFNERVKPPSSKVKKALIDFLNKDELQIYPEYGKLEEKIASFLNINPDLIITNGADQAIDLIFRTFTKIGDVVIIPTPSFPMFYQSAGIVGNKIIAPLYNKTDLSFPVDEVLKNIAQHVKLIVICNPNNPTGTLLPLAGIEKIAKAAKDAIILIDEIYAEFSKVSAINLIEKYPNIIVARSFSKAFGLAALRVGYLVASSQNITELLKVRGPYDINMTAYIAALAALDDQKDMQVYVDEVMQKAKPLVETFFLDNNILFYKSEANFILFKPVNPQEVEKILRKNGILIRPQDKPGIQGTLRVSIGTVSQMQKFIDIYKKFVLNQEFSSKNKYAFIDRDGTLIFEPQDTFQIDSLDKLKILDGAIDGLKKLINMGYKLIMISNQDGLGTNAFPQKDFELPQNKMLETFEKEGINFEEIFICPHLPSENCDCRKPKIGLVKDILDDTDKETSFVYGDRESDKKFAENIGVKFIEMQTNDNFYKPLKKKGVIS